MIWCWGIISYVRTEVWNEREEIEMLEMKLYVVYKEYGDMSDPVGSRIHDAKTT